MSEEGKSIINGDDTRKKYFQEDKGAGINYPSEQKTTR